MLLLLSGLCPLIQEKKQPTLHACIYICFFFFFFSPSLLYAVHAHEPTSTPTPSGAQALQSELRNSEAKVSGLETQVSQLSVRAGRNSSTKAGGGGGGGGMASVGSRNSGSGGGGGGEMGGEGNTARGTEVTEAEIASLRRQMKAAIQVWARPATGTYCCVYART